MENEILKEIRSEYLLGIARMEERMLKLLDADKLL
jgi:chemotaxis signal transduction protein